MGEAVVSAPLPFNSAKLLEQPFTLLPELLEKCEFCEKLGADAAFNYREQDFSEEIINLTEGKGVDVILDMVGGPYFPKNIGLLAVEGRLVQIALMQGSKAEVDFLALLLKRVTLTGSTLRPRTVEQKTEIAQALRENVWPLLESGAVRPIIHQTFPRKGRRSTSA